MWKPYLQVIAGLALHAIHIQDRDRVASHMNKSIDEVRAMESKNRKSRGK